MDRLTSRAATACCRIWPGCGRLRCGQPEGEASDRSVGGGSAPPPSPFNKNFEDAGRRDRSARPKCGYRTGSCFGKQGPGGASGEYSHQIGRGEAKVEAPPVTLHEASWTSAESSALYRPPDLLTATSATASTAIRRDEQMTVAELNRLRPGDYVVHIDHGVGRFDGLVKINENGRCTGGDQAGLQGRRRALSSASTRCTASRATARATASRPKSTSSATGPGRKLKNAAKKAVKDISRELIALYARRKASKGFAFSPDGYLQNELEASFAWGGYARPAERLGGDQAGHGVGAADGPASCGGDVGFGKTEVAIRAAFRAVRRQAGGRAGAGRPSSRCNTSAPSRQRLRDFPIRVEYLEPDEIVARDDVAILAELAAGRSTS